MIDDCFPALLDELEKVAIELSNKEKRRQAIQFGVLGAASVPAMKAILNKIQLGRVIPSWTSPGRWAASTAVEGLIAGAALPLMRHSIERQVQGQAEERLRRKRISRALKEFHKVHP